MVARQVSDAGEIGDSLLILATLDQIARGLVLEEGEAENQSSEDDVETGRDFLLAVSTGLVCTCMS